MVGLLSSSVSDSSASSRWSFEAILREENSGMKKWSSSSELPVEFSQSLSLNCLAYFFRCFHFHFRYVTLVRYIYIYIICVPTHNRNNKFILYLYCSKKRWPISNAENLKLG